MQHFISAYGYLAILLLMTAEAACIPVPSELTMPLGGALAAGAVAGVHLDIWLVIATGIAGNVIGSYLAWALGRYGGWAAWRRWSHADPQAGGLERAQRWFDRYGGRAVCIGRLLPVVRTFISLPAGLARMPPLRFGIYTVVGCVPWIAGLAWAGYATGASWQQITSAFRVPAYAVAGIVAVAIVVAVVVAVRRRRRGQAQRDDTEAGREQGSASGERTGGHVMRER